MPISQPVLTARTRQTQIVEGQQIILNCEVDRSSPEILYQFLHEDTVLWETKTSSILASFSLTAKHSGNYYCIANSGFGPKRSKVLKLSVIGKPWVSSCPHRCLDSASSLTLLEIYSHLPVSSTSSLKQLTVLSTTHQNGHPGERKRRNLGQRDIRRVCTSESRGSKHPMKKMVANSDEAGLEMMKAKSQAMHTEFSLTDYS